MNVAILASGDGSNAENIIRYCHSHKTRLIAKCVITDNSVAGVISRAEELRTPIHIVPYDINKKKIENEKTIINILHENKIDLICLAGYMKILSNNFINMFNFKIVNIHPSLLPKYSGKSAYERAYHSKDVQSGCTIHYVDTGIDTGPIIFQESFTKSSTDTLEEFKAKGLKLEHQLYKKFLKYWEQNRYYPQES
ncbi:MAG: phosphoribosylglycinamide formyltransferase [Bdellovibrionales bacterium]|jgi:phosphoribosylglycinamide formyltransferase 1|nr:phosphoribosylglycinamide formyltransferase [Bdellovibrionales bacterium]